MRYEEAMEKHGGLEALSEFERGWITGVRAYAWMKDGATFVGTTGTLLGDAIDRFLTDREKEGRRR